MANALDQFRIEPIVPIHVGNLDLSFTNSSLYMVAAVVISTVFLTAAMRRRTLIPGRFQSVAELFYEFVAATLRNNASEEAWRYFPLIFTVFMFVLCGNLLGLTPYGFTYTSHIIVTGGLALFIILFVTVVGFMKHGLGYFHALLPTSVPGPAGIIMVPVELFSYFARAFSLSVRLTANMISGHIMLHVVTGFVVALGVWGGWVPFLGAAAIITLEVLIACLQAYIFTILSCVYLESALHLH